MCLNIANCHIKSKRNRVRLASFYRACLYRAKMSRCWIHLGSYFCNNNNPVLLGSLCSCRHQNYRTFYNSIYQTRRKWNKCEQIWEQIYSLYSIYLLAIAYRRKHFDSVTGACITWKTTIIYSVSAFPSIGTSIWYITKVATIVR